jgi:hypothetical protein
VKTNHLQVFVGLLFIHEAADAARREDTLGTICMGITGIILIARAYLGRK